MALTARLAFLAGVAGLACFLLGPLLVRVGLPPLAGFALFALGALLGGALAVLLGAIGVFRTRGSTGREGASRAWFGLGAGIALIATVFLLAPAGNVPPIHDLTTNPDDPPTFDAIAALPEVAGRDWSYPHGSADTAEQQRQHYADLGPIELDISPEQALERAKSAAEELGWTIVKTDFESGTLEAYQRTSVFRFIDDVAVRVRDDAGGSVIDVRSTSRVGQSDLGANAERIRAFRDAVTR